MSVRHFTIRDAVRWYRHTAVVYAAEEDTQLVCATYPDWQDAQRRSPHAAMLDDFRPV